MARPPGAEDHMGPSEILLLDNSSTYTENITSYSDCRYFPASNSSSGCWWTNWTNATDEDSTTTPGFSPEESADKVYWALVLVLLPFLAVFGNILIILSVYKERSLQTVTNYFIVSLAFADLLVAAVVMPFAVYVLVNVEWELSDTLCDFYIAVDVTCSTASIFNLVAISIDRFIAVTQPIKYSKHKNNKRVTLTIAIVWLVSAAIGSPIVLGLNTSPERSPQLCIFYNSDFIIYSSLSSFYIPCLVMVFLYYKIFKVIHERAKKALAKKAARPQSSAKTAGNLDLIIENVAAQQETTLNSSTALLGGKQRSEPGAKSARALAASGMETDAVTNTGSGSQNDDDEEDEQTEDRVGEDECHIILTNEKFLLSAVPDPGVPHPETANGNADSGYAASNMEETQFCVQNPNTQSPEKVRRSVVIVDSEQSSKKNGTVNQAGGQSTCQAVVSAVSFPVPPKKSRFNLGRKHKSSRKKRERASAKRERKATKTLAIVLGVFLFCWVPFFTCNIMDAICIKLGQAECRPGVTVFLLTTWLGYINSCVNPVIYTIFNPEFRKSFKKLIMESCK